MLGNFTYVPTILYKWNLATMQAVKIRNVESCHFKCIQTLPKSHIIVEEQLTANKTAIYIYFLSKST
jgi:hypothetical protein